MIRATMAVAAVAPARPGRAEQARRARFARLVALILDTIFVSVLTFVATSVYGVTAVTWGSPLANSSGSAYFGSQTAIPAVWTAAVWLVYYTVCETMFSATPGKVLNGLRVVSVDLRPLTLSGVVVRNLLRLVDVLPGIYLLGGFVMLATSHSQRLGDLLAGSTVVFCQDALEPGAARTSRLSARIVFVVAVVTALVFTAAFDYFERPVLVIESAYDQHQLINPGIVSYSLGQPARTFDTATYPITARTSTESCTGSINLYWQGLFGWQIGGGRLDCFPS